MGPEKRNILIWMFDGDGLPGICLFSSIVIVMETKFGTSKIKVSIRLPLCSQANDLISELEGFETSNYSRLAVVSYRSVAWAEDKDRSKNTRI